MFARLLAVVRARSDLMRHAPMRDGTLVQVTALANIARFKRGFVREPEAWPGACGHPLAVVDSLASHLFDVYPTPRFVASVWFGDDDARIRWAIAHARGQAFRKMALPVAFSRQMEHWFLRTPDHIGFDRAMRRAEVLGLGGSPELADAVSETVLGEQFADADAWRKALAWLARCDAVDLAQVGPVIDFLRAHIHSVSVRGRTFASVLRLVAQWHVMLASQRRTAFAWPRSRWRELTLRVDDAEWTIVELLDTRALSEEGRRMRHCVATYARSCRYELSRIFSLRHRRRDDADARSVLTIEVAPRSRTIVQVRGPANSRPDGDALLLVQQWAAREGLAVSRF
ncbi:MAG TPA: PcfJ domain-containing protein [Kofleriaceae bacterium]|nr:PcfJ domain-containing protein [Kofleriaceae bacterium]